MFAKKFKLATLLPGYDANSEKPALIWTNGGEWYEFQAAPLPWSLIFGMALDASKCLTPQRSDMPIEAVAAEVEKKWPGRWQGPFEVGATGVRFWDDSADNSTGCQVKPDGLLRQHDRLARAQILPAPRWPIRTDLMNFPERYQWTWQFVWPPPRRSAARR